MINIHSARSVRSPVFIVSASQHSRQTNSSSIEMSTTPNFEQNVISPNAPNERKVKKRKKIHPRLIQYQLQVGIQNANKFPVIFVKQKIQLINCFYL